MPHTIIFGAAFLTFILALVGFLLIPLSYRLKLSSKPILYERTGGSTLILDRATSFEMKRYVMMLALRAKVQRLFDLRIVSTRWAFMGYFVELYSKRLEARILHVRDMPNPFDGHHE